MAAGDGDRVDENCIAGQHSGMHALVAPFVTLLATIAPLVAQTKPQVPTEPPLVWNADVRRHVAAALVVRGIVRVDRDAVDKALTQGGHVDVKIEVQEMVHGAEQATVTFRCYVRERTNPRPDEHPTPAELLALDGADRIVFLCTVEAANYLVDDDGSAIVPPERDVLAALKRREVQHRRLLATPLPVDARHAKPLATILRDIVVDRDHQRAAFVDLEALGRDAVPTIVASMDDRRQLPVRELTLKNRAADAFEAQRRYSPKRVVDGIAAVLNQLTGESFGSLYNGARDEERAIAVQAWTLYAHYQLAAAAPAAEQQPKKAR